MANAEIEANRFHNEQMQQQRSREGFLINRYRAFNDTATTDPAAYKLRGFWQDEDSSGALLHITENRQTAYRIRKAAGCYKRSQSYLLTTHELSALDESSGANGIERLSLRRRAGEKRGYRFHYVVDDQDQLSTEEIFTNGLVRPVIYNSIFRFDAEDLLCPGEQFAED